MPEQLWFTRFLNAHFGAMVTAMLRGLHFEPHFPAAPITNAFAMELLVFVLLLIFFLVVRLRLAVDKPPALQNVVEMLEEYIGEQGSQIIGHDYKTHLSYVMALGYFILLANLLGLIPGLESPTASPVVPLGFAATTFIYYHFYGIRHHGHHYIKQFIGPVLLISPLMFVIEVISHIARILSLTVRLYANMFAGDLVTLAFFSLVPVLVPVLFLFLHLGVAIIQTYIFIMLTMVYLGNALSEEH
jgi:F-type H+-transporting ATPase subunit a